uniref:Uncharacterized protein n=1 Tax=Arundo donax TaxID=35708 RepID=A0A0A9A5C8_ARUDO
MCKIPMTPSISTEICSCQLCCSIFQF